jgi:cytochrome b involved in lipid metabolism
VLYQGTVYDVEKYKFNHPGGDSIIKDNLGKNIEEVFEE